MSVYDNNQVHFSGLSMVTATLGINDPEVGAVRRDGDEEYIFVYNAGNSQINPGYGAIVSAVTGYSVTLSSVSGNGDFPIGICRHATLTTGTYGWLMKKGFTNFKATADSAAVAGNQLVMGDDGVWGTKTISTGYIGNTFGKVMIATASAGTGVGYFAIY